jgi:hypothetical protein
MIIENISNRSIVYNTNHDIHINEYYQYCVSLFKKFLLENDVKINFIIGNLNPQIQNENKTLKIDIQCEHTLVMEGGRSVDQKIFGTIKTKRGDRYLIRIDKFNYYNSIDCVIEYSLPNIKNISTNAFFNEYSKKILYISPTIYETNIGFLNNKKLISALWSKSSPNQRRSNTISRLVEKGINAVVVDNCFTKQQLLKFYNSSRIIINIHQTEEHHTFEEIRILPAIMNGVLVVSEDSPLKEEVPYNKFIVWCKYEEIPEKVVEIEKNYEFYYNKTFNNPEFFSIFEEMRNKNLEKLSDFICKFTKL